MDPEKVRMIKMCEELIDRHPEWNENKADCSKYIDLLQEMRQSSPESFPKGNPLLNILSVYGGCKMVHTVLGFK